MAAWDVFIPSVLVHAPGAPDPYARMCLRRAAREFCRMTHVWTQWVDCASASPPVGDYTLTLPAGAEAHRIEDATLDGAPLELERMSDVGRDLATYAAEETRAFYSDDLKSVVLSGESTTGTLRARVSLMPTLASTTCPDILAGRWFEAIVSGGTWKLLSTSNASFSDPKRAETAAGEFREAIGEAVSAVHRANTRRTPRLRPHWC